VRWIQVKRILLMTALVACGGKTAGPSQANQAPRGRVGDRSIRSVDWQNRTYASGGRSYSVLGGETDLYYDARDKELQPAEWAVQYPGVEPVARGYFMVSAPVFGDVDRDGVEEAAITTTINAGGSGQLSTVALYEMRDGAPVLVAEIPGGDRADGGIAGVEIAGNGEILVERYVNSGGGACCPSASIHEVWRWNGRALVEDEARRSLPFPL
jgi:hypothetical protein